MDQTTSAALQSEKNSASPQAKKIQENIRIFLFGFVGLIVALAVILGCVGIYRVYAQAKTDPFTLVVARFLRLPAAKVNGEAITYSDYTDDLKAIGVMRAYAKQNNAPGADLTDEQMSDQVLFRMANNILIKEATTARNLTVSPEDVTAIKNQIMQQFKTIAEVDTELKKRYGWDFKTYETKVIVPFVLQNKLAEALSADQSSRDEIRKTAESVLKQIKGGADFAEMAKKYGEDGTAQSGGELGYFGKGEMVPQFEAVAFALKKGELSPQLVQTQYGFHIVQVEDRKTVTKKDTSGKTVTAEQVKARHILFRFPTLDKFLQDQLKKVAIDLYIKVHNPFSDLKK